MGPNFVVPVMLVVLALSAGCAVVSPSKSRRLDDPKKNARYKEAIRVEPIRFYPTVSEAVEALKSVIREIEVRQYQEGATLSYPLTGFDLDGNRLILRYRTEGGEKTEIFALDHMRLTGNILAPNEQDPHWDLWLVHAAPPSGVPDIFPLGSRDRQVIETAFQAIHSLMAAARNPHILSRNVPPTLSLAFRGEAGPAPILLRPAKWGFAAIPDEAGEGLRVTRVDKGSPSDIAGLQPDDRIIEINGARVSKLEDVPRLLRLSENMLKIRRGGEEMVVKLLPELEF